MSKIIITELEKIQPSLNNWLKKAGRKTLKFLKIEKEISLIIVGSQKIKELNRQYRQQDKATDVLSFGADYLKGWQGKKEERFLGEVMICLPKAKQQASNFKTSLKKELTRLLVHGLLHLAGFDHEKSKRNEEKMFKKQEEILKLCFNCGN